MTLTYRIKRFLNRNGPAILDKLKTVFWLWVGYSLLWIPFFIIAWLMQLTDDPTTKTIYQVVLYAGYPGLGLLYFIGGLLALPVMALMGLFAITFPWGMYAAPFVVLAIYLYVRFFRVTVTQSPEQVQAALRKSAPFNPHERPRK